MRCGRTALDAGWHQLAVAAPRRADIAHTAPRNLVAVGAFVGLVVVGCWDHPDPLGIKLEHGSVATVGCGTQHLLPAVVSIGQPAPDPIEHFEGVLWDASLSEDLGQVVEPSVEASSGQPRHHFVGSVLSAD